MNDEVVKYAEELGIDLIGFIKPVIDMKLYDSLEKNKEYRSSFINDESIDRVNYLKVLPGCKTVVSVGLAYQKRKIELLKFSSLGTNIDYHETLTEMMEKLSEFITLNYGGECIHMVDNGVLVDRDIAFKAGHGFYGKNNFIINEQFGSYVNYGEILTTVEFDTYEHKLESKCGTCNKCIQACKTKCLTENYLDADCCFSYLTQSNKILTLAEKESFTDSIYGCDICQIVCPYNDKNETSNVSIFECDVDELLEISKRDFRTKYINAPFYWRGKNVIRRNIILTLGNLNKIEYLDKFIEMEAHEQSNIVKDALNYAIAKMNGDV